MVPATRCGPLPGGRSSVSVDRPPRSRSRRASRSNSQTCFLVSVSRSSAARAVRSYWYSYLRAVCAPTRSLGSTCPSRGPPLTIRRWRPTPTVRDSEMGRLASSRDRHNGQRIDLVDAVPPCSEGRIIRGPGHEHCPQVLHEQEQVIGDPWGSARTPRFRTNPAPRRPWHGREVPEYRRCRRLRRF